MAYHMEGKTENPLFIVKKEEECEGALSTDPLSETPSSAKTLIGSEGSTCKNSENSRLTEMHKPKNKLDSYDPSPAPGRQFHVLGSSSDSIGRAEMASMNLVNFMVKEEIIEWEETWQSKLKDEPMSPPSQNNQSDRIDESDERDMNVKVEDIFKEEKSELSEELTDTCVWKKEGCEFSEDNFRRSHIKCTGKSCSSQISSSIQSHGVEMTGTQKQLSKHFSCEYQSLLLPDLKSGKSIAVATCSTADNSVGQEEVADTSLLKELGKQLVGGQMQKQHSDHSESTNCAIQGETHFQSPLDKKPFKCKHCWKPFETKTVLNKHLRFHTASRPYQCSQCGKSFTQSGSLSRHMRIHTGERPFKCSECGNSFSTSSTLIGHMRLHNGDRPYKCSQCGKSFITSSRVTEHMRKHSGDRPHSCSQCGKSFTYRSTLTSHMRIHIGDRPYKCSQCGKAFKRNSHLTRHSRKHIADQHRGENMG